MNHIKSPLKCYLELLATYHLLDGTYSLSLSFLFLFKIVIMTYMEIFVAYLSFYLPEVAVLCNENPSVNHRKKSEVETWNNACQKSWQKKFVIVALERKWFEGEIWQSSDQWWKCWITIIDTWRPSVMTRTYGQLGHTLPQLCLPHPQKM